MKFLSIDHFLESIPEVYSNQFLQARLIIKRLVPKAIEGIKYNTPFYTMNGLFIYFSYSAKAEARIGFCQGNEMTDEAPKLSADENQVYIRHWKLSKTEPLEVDLLAAYIMAAAEIQMLKRPFVKKKA